MLTPLPTRSPLWAILNRPSTRPRSPAGARSCASVCAIEAPISIVTARYDLARFGAEALRASPRQADLIILSGRVSIKMAPVVRRLYDQMLEPKWAISMGACSSSGGMFANYAVVQGADKNGRFYWIEPGEHVIDPLNFATAERLPDPVLSVRAVGDLVSAVRDCLDDRARQIARIALVRVRSAIGTAVGQQGIEPGQNGGGRIGQEAGRPCAGCGSG